MNLSEHFTLEEATKSLIADDNHIANIPTPFIVDCMKNTAVGMEKVRYTLVDAPIHINSWYRCNSLNNRVGSKPTSQHLKGEAVDFICPEFGSPVEICKALIDVKRYIEYDQLILEHTWVHISFCSDPSRIPRNEVLSLLQSGGYAVGLTDSLGNPFN